MNTPNFSKSNKILGLEKLSEAGYNVPAFLPIPNYEAFDVDYAALNYKYKIPPIQSYIEGSIEELGFSESGYSLRSASLDEDGSNLSSAGRYISFNGLKNFDDIYLSAIKIWKYHRSIAQHNINCPLILQKTHCSYFSGVYFSQNTNNNPTSIIESYYGSCRSLVDGTVLQYRSTFKDDNWSHNFEEQSNWCYKFYCHSDLFYNSGNSLAGNILNNKYSPFPTRVRKFLDSKENEFLVYGYRPSSPPEWYYKNVCLVLNELAAKIDNGNGVDVEWGTSYDGQLFVYQYRPLTRPIFISENNAQNNSMSDEVYNSNSVYKGISASGGSSNGYIVSFDTPNKPENYILMLQDATVKDINVLSSSKGVICSIGGILSHLAIVCRELGIPCIIGIKQTIPIHTFVKMDASTGVIEVTPDIKNFNLS